MFIDPVTFVTAKHNKRLCVQTGQKTDQLMAGTYMVHNGTYGRHSLAN